MYTLPNETSLTIKRILQNIVKIQQKDFSVIKQTLACSQHTSKERRTLHTTCSRLWQLLDKVKGSDIACLSAMINNLPNISHAELVFLNEQILPIWLKFICGDILSVLCFLFTINRSPQLLSIASDVLLLCRPPVLDKLDNAQTYIKQLLEDGAPIEMLSDCVI